MNSNEIRYYWRTRDGLPDLLHHLNLVGDGVEVGVNVGWFSALVRSRWNGRKLYCVDIWEIPGMMEAAQRTIGACGRPFELIKDTSVNAATRFADESLDWAFLDADHSYPSLNQDLPAWYPKVKPGGVLCGHDYIDGCWQYMAWGSAPGIPNNDTTMYGVRSAVNLFAADHNLYIFETSEPCPSWLLIKR